MFPTKAWDSTPTTVEFGTLSDVLSPVARYRYTPDDGASWQVLNFNELCKLGYRRKRGILELLACRFALVWSEPEGLGGDIPIRRVENLIVKPRFIEDTTASTYFSALDSANPHLPARAVLGCAWT